MVLSINGSSLQGLPDFLNASCADLTPFLSGDAIKEFPNLANFPPFAWPNSVVNGHMYFIPVLGGVGGNSMMVKQKALDAAGVQSITTADEFIQAARAVTIPGTQYAIGSNVAITSPLQWFLPMFGAPNGWRESGGKLTRDLETQEFADAVAYVRSLWDAGVIHPDLPGMSALQTSQNFYSGKIVMYLMNLAAFPLVWRQSLAQDPEFDPRIIKPFSHDGKSAGGQFVGPGANGLTVLKKAEPDRVKEVLGVLNFLAAPFGTQEMLLRLYGVQGTDFNFDDKGNPELTQPGMQDVSVPYQAVISMPESFYYPTLPPDAVRTVYQAEVDAFAVGVRSPLVGLYSRADGDSGAVLQQHVNDGINSIIYGREPVTTLSQIVTDWRTNGGDTIRTEYERALQSSKT
jgi:putative aldouronate transport system substrate-binding protein